MIFYLHYILLTSGTCGATVLLGVFIKNYSNATQGEIGFLIMSLPLLSIITKPLFCAMADRRMAHKAFLVGFLLFLLLGFTPIVIIPFFPDFYQNYARLSFFLLFLSIHVGNCGLVTAWSLGETLAVNYAHRTGIAYSRMRLMGTISWGVYGYIIGLVNEVSFLPKYVPCYIIFYISVVIDIILILLWNNDDFVLVDSTSKMTELNELKSIEYPQPASGEGDGDNKKEEQPDKVAESTQKPSMMKNSSSLSNKLTQQRNVEENTKVTPEIIEKTKNPQMRLLRMITAKDGRVVKYFIVFIIFGALISPINFVFISYEDICKQKGCNFSFLTGTVLVSQAAAETVFFFVMPWILKRISNRLALSIAFMVLTVRYYIYSQFFYQDYFSPYWALLLEWGHGIAYSFVVTILADIAYSTANLSKLFIPELRKLGYLSDTKGISKEQVEAEEHSVKLALRATTMALNTALYEGLGFGIGSLLAGQVAERYSYITLTALLSSIAFVSMFIYVLVEYSNSRWSDTYKPVEGTKAYEIMEASQEAAILQKKNKLKKKKIKEGQEQPADSGMVTVNLTSEA